MPCLFLEVSTHSGLADRKVNNLHRTHSIHSTEAEYYSVQNYVQCTLQNFRIDSLHFGVYSDMAYFPLSVLSFSSGSSFQALLSIPLIL